MGEPTMKKQMTTMKPARESGFTLVEIAIVLVIIGLLLGGILKGQELITQARIRNIVNELVGIEAVVLAYQDRYRAMPGDDVGAGRWVSGVTTMPGGDSNGQIGGHFNEATAASEPESRLFWAHLRQAGFLAGPTLASGSLAAAAEQPRNAVGGIIGVNFGGLGFTGNVLCTSNLPDKVAIAVDTQLDDGKGKTGSIRAWQGSVVPGQPVDAKGLAALAAGSDYQETGQNVYLLCRSL